MPPDSAHCSPGARITPCWDSLFQTEPNRTELNQTKIGHDIWGPGFSFDVGAPSQGKPLGLSLRPSHSCGVGLMLLAALAPGGGATETVPGTWEVRERRCGPRGGSEGDAHVKDLEGDRALCSLAFPDSAGASLLCF